jgi:hypothetical protein
MSLWHFSAPLKHLQVDHERVPKAELPTRFTRIVVIDHQGRYVIPDLPKARYRVWPARLWTSGLPKVDGEPSQQVDLLAVVAPTEAAASQYYPAIYW